MQDKLLKRARLGCLRQLHTEPALIDFASNDYLGLANSKRLAAAVLEEWSRSSKLGSTGSRLLTGHTVDAQELEHQVASFHGYEAGLLFGCGYMANVGLMSAIADKDDTILFDARVHASTLDGIRLSRGQAFPFRHNDVQHLEERLKKRSPKGQWFICIESIYSTDGSMAPLPSICELANRYGAHLIVDEAHAIGVYGPEGRGLVAAHHLTSRIFAQVNTFGKALGTYGAIVLGSSILKQSLINFAHSCMYTTALPFYALCAIKCSYEAFPSLHQEREHLMKLCQTLSSAAHIYFVKVKDSAKDLSQRLKEAGFDARPLLSPTVQRGQEGVRICLHAFNTQEDVARLRACLKGYLCGL